MTTFLRVIGVISLAIALVLVASLLWRWASRHRSLPCPTCFAWFLEWNLVDKLLGTQATLDRIGLKPGQRVLEIGPGPGRLLIPAAKRVLPGGEAVGLDIQPGMIERLMARAEKAGLSNVTAILGSAEETHVQPGRFDVVFLCTTLGEIPDREAALQQCYAALRPGGLLSITEMFPDPHYQSRSTVKRLAEAAGFRLTTLHGPPYFFTTNFTKESERVVQ